MSALTTRRLRLDFETRSAIPISTSYRRYFGDPSFDLLCAAYAFDIYDPETDALLDRDPVSVWRPGHPVPADVVAHIASGGEVHAWNAVFEFHCLGSAAARRHGWPAAKIEQMHCTMCRAGGASFPFGLANAAASFRGISQKQDSGKGLIQTLSMPQLAPGTAPATRRRAA